MNRCTTILKNYDRELPVEIVVEPASKTIHVRVEWIDTQLLVDLIQDQFVALVNDDGYKIWLHIINCRVDIGIEVCEATLTVEMQKDTLIIRPLERPRYD